MRANFDTNLYFNINFSTSCIKKGEVKINIQLQPFPLAGRGGEIERVNGGTSVEVVGREPLSLPVSGVLGIFGRVAKACLKLFPLNINRSNMKILSHKIIHNNISPSLLIATKIFTHP